MRAMQFNARRWTVLLALMMVFAAAAATPAAGDSTFEVKEASVEAREADVLPSCVVVPEESINRCFDTQDASMRFAGALATDRSVQALSGCVVKLYNWFSLNPSGGVITVYGATGSWVNLSSSWINKISSVDATGSCGVILSDYYSGGGAQYVVSSGTYRNSLGSMTNDANAYLTY
jgi:hypothetical protein